jgi:energy-coupling factor transporter ATP-binding protein EcfA2
MKFLIQNIGIVKEANITLKPLTVFVGKNNMGKSWIAYILSGIFTPFSWGHYSIAYKNNELINHYPELDEAINKLFSEGTSQFNYVDFCLKYYTSYINDIGRLFPNWSNEFFATDGMLFKDLKIHVTEKPNKKELREFLLNCDIDDNFPSNTEKRDAIVSVVKEEKNPLVYFYSKEKDLLKKYPEKDIKEFIALVIFFHIMYLHVNMVYYFPTERSGLVPILSSNKEQYELSIIRRRKKFVDFREEETYVFEPIFNLIHNFRKIQLEGDPIKRLKSAENTSEIKKYIEVGNILQKEILGGNLDFSESEPNLPRKLIYKFSDDKIALDMHVVSSMIKDFAPFILYLKYRATKDDLIVIDEPEMNLHPESQVKFIELITILVNHDINVLITTHSPYIVDHLANLIKADRSENKEKISKKFFLKRKESFIDCEKVSVYLFEKGRVKNILNKSGEINWDTFSKVSERIFQIQKEI